MMLNIVEHGDVVGWVTDEPDFEYEYAGAKRTVERVLRDQREAGWTIDAAAGPGGVTAETRTEASAGEKLSSSLDALRPLPGMRFEERTETEKALEDADHRSPEEVLGDPDEPTTNSLGLKAEDRVYVDNRHEAPDGAVVHHEEDGGLYYVPEDARLSEEKAAGTWVPYTGPSGGEGWRNLDNDKVVYQDEPPGMVPDIDDIDDGTLESVANEYGVTVDEVRDAMRESLNPDEPGVPEFSEGDTVTFDHPDFPGVELTGVVDFTDGDFVDVDTPRGTFEVEAEDILDVEDYGKKETEYGNFNPPRMDIGAGDFERGMVEAGAGEDAIDLFREHVDDGVPPDTAVRRALDGAGYEWHERDDISRAADIAASQEKRYSDNTAPDHLDPSAADDVVPMEEMMSGGSTAAGMDIATMPDGSRLYITRIGTGQNPLGSDVEQRPYNAESAVAGHDFMKALGMEVPDHHYEVNRFMSVEEADGMTPYELLWENEGGDVPALDTGQAFRTGAAQVLIGNVDPNSGNFVIGDDGKVVPIDLDFTGSDITDTTFDEPVGDRIAGEFAETLAKFGPYDHLDVEDVKARVLEQAAELANSEGVDEAIEAVRGEETREIIRKNVEAMRGYES